MALATQCPHCQTTFRVVHDQLKLRAGLVRCGSCKEIFNGIEHLLPQDDHPASAPLPATPSRAPEVPASAIAANEAAPTASADAHTSAVAHSSPEQTPEKDRADAEQQARETLQTAAETYPTSHLSFALPPHFEREITPVYGKDDPKPDDPLQRMTLLDYSGELPDEIEGPPDPHRTTAEDDPSTPEFEAHEPDELDKAIDDLQRKPWRGSKKRQRASEIETEETLDDEIEEDEPGFVRKERARQQMSRRTRTILLSASMLLFIVALLQATYVFRHQLASIFPQSKPVFVKLCSMLDCRVDLPAHIGAVSIESSELQSQTPDRRLFMLTTLLRNDSTFAQEWPSIELTLNDANEKPLLRRVFSAHDYLRDDFMVKLGFPPETERTARITFELDDVRASGYRVYLFYP